MPSSALFLCWNRDGVQVCCFCSPCTDSENDGCVIHTHRGIPRGAKGAESKGKSTARPLRSVLVTNGLSFAKYIWQVEEQTMQTTPECTLLELVKRVNEVTDDDDEVVAAVVNMVNSGRVRLRGNFAGAKIKLPASLSLFPQRLWPTLLGLQA